MKFSVEFLQDTNVLFIDNYDEELGNQIYSDELVVKESKFNNCEIIEETNEKIAIRLPDNTVAFNIPMQNVLCWTEEESSFEKDLNKVVLSM